jgi:hypothetical protein
MRNKNCLLPKEGARDLYNIPAHSLVISPVSRISYGFLAKETITVTLKGTQ